MSFCLAVLLKSMCVRAKEKRSRLGWIMVKITPSLGEQFISLPAPQRAQVNELSEMEGHKSELPGGDYTAHPSFRKC